jgi:MFS superfamily sulfate permease-like transporter
LERAVGRRQWTWNEISGSLGDLGTFLPLLIGLTSVVGLDLGTTLLFTGVYNVLSGFLFEVPIPVQPMKTIAAVALAENPGLSIPEIMAAGIFVSSCVLFLGASGLMGMVSKLIPGPVIRGMQLGVGLNLSLKGFKYIWYEDGKSGDIRQMWSVNGLFLGMVTLLFILLTAYQQSVSNGTAKEDEKEENTVDDDESKIQCSCVCGNESASGPIVMPVGRRENNSHLSGDQGFGQTRLGQDGGHIHQFFWGFFRQINNFIILLGDKASLAVDGVPTKKSHMVSCHSLPSKNKIPSALIIVALGIILTIASKPSVLSTLSLGPSTPSVIVPTSDEWRTGILRAGLPQLPLTTLNSVISVCQLATQLFPDRPAKPGEVATSVGMMNLVGCWFGAMPSCHGAGGLAAQVRFGARWGTAPIFLGLIKIFLSLLFGSSLFSLLQDFPTPLLGAMLFFSGIELASVAKQRGHRGQTIMLGTAAISLAVSNVAIGLCASYIIALYDYVLPLLVYFVSNSFTKIAGLLWVHQVPDTGCNGQNV